MVVLGGLLTPVVLNIRRRRVGSRSRCWRGWSEAGATPTFRTKAVVRLMHPRQFARSALSTLKSAQIVQVFEIMTLSPLALYICQCAR